MPSLDDPTYFAVFFILFPGTVAALVVFSVTFPGARLSKALLKERGPVHAPGYRLRAALRWLIWAGALATSGILGVLTINIPFTFPFLDRLVAVVALYTATLGLISLFLAPWALLHAAYCLARHLYALARAKLRGHALQNGQTAR